MKTINAFCPNSRPAALTVERLSLRADAALQRCAFLISSGCVISREAFMRLGRFDEALFIDHVDTEYCLRALLRNVPVYVVPSLVLLHRIGSRRRHKLGSLELTTMNHPGFRRYYSARNAMQLALQYGLRLPVADRAERADALANRTDRAGGERQAGEAQCDCDGLFEGCSGAWGRSSGRVRVLRPKWLGPRMRLMRLTAQTARLGAMNRR